MLSQELRQSLTLSQFQIQALRTLSMSGAELNELLKKEEVENPVFDLEQSMPLSRKLRSAVQEEDDGSRAIERVADKHGDILQFLESQLPRRATGEEQHVFRQMVSFLEPGTGLLPESVRELSEILGAPLHTVERCLSWLHGMEPAGIGAATPSESLVLQAFHKGWQDPQLYTILFDHLEDIAAGRYRRIMKAQKLTMQQVEAYIAQIRSLEPYPTAGFEDGRLPVFIVPDLLFEPDAEGVWRVLVNDRWSDHVPYGELYHMRTGSADPELKTYLQERQSHANFIVQCVERRRSTLLQLGRCVLEAQLDFLTKDEPLHSLTREDLAARTGLSLATVSRAFKDKYVQTPKQIYPFSFFLSKSSGKSPAREGASRSEALAALGRLVAEEDPAQPLSDEQIAARLAQSGVPLSRRTVAKYRVILGIPCAYDRKR